MEAALGWNAWGSVTVTKGSLDVGEPPLCEEADRVVREATSHGIEATSHASETTSHGCEALVS